MLKISFAGNIPSEKTIARVSFVYEDESEVVRLSTGRKEIACGVGGRDEFNHRKLILVVRKIVFFARQHKIERLALSFKDFFALQSSLSESYFAELMAIQFEMANFEFIRFKTAPQKDLKFVKEIIICGTISREVRAGFERGIIIGREINACRELSNTPGGDMTPRVLAKEAEKAIRGTGIKIKVLHKKELEKLGMGGVLGVARGSVEEPKFIILEYRRGGKEKPIVLVGKGVTFDTGGLNLKPESGILEMHMDMSGGAAVIHTMVLAAKLKFKKNIVGLVPAVENMPSGSSYRPGDVLKTLLGKTIEVLNTDAEGRIILADALAYAKRYNPKLVIDVATLTGAASVALGERASAIFSKDEKLLRTIQEIGEATGEYVWPLPLWDEYFDEIKGTFGDIANSSKSRYGGASTAAIFLYQFIKDTPWLHIDIAPRMSSMEGEYLSKGAVGAPIALLIKFLETH